MRIVREVAFIQYAEQSVCIISRNCCRSIGKWVKRPLTRHLVLRALEAGECLSAANQEMYIYAQTWSGYLLQFLRDSRLLNRFVVHRLQRLKSSHLDIVSKCILFLFYVLVLISSIYLFLSMFVLVFCQFIGFPLLLLFIRIPLLLIPGPSNLSWLNPRISNHCNTLPSNDIEVKRYFAPLLSAPRTWSGGMLICVQIIWWPLELWFIRLFTQCFTWNIALFVFYCFRHPHS